MPPTRGAVTSSQGRTPIPSLRRPPPGLTPLDINDRSPPPTTMTLDQTSVTPPDSTKMQKLDTWPMLTT
ncbi:MAG: hypothetical protein K9G71_20025 [Rhodobacteraceae bacterium]|nr:hypothetical protein [Paracoccaceae bacterium]MCF8516757.1 hypothetical protein [Paracoccaceae bacterium]MCF8521071.1 hypothetical protein [Paracoccaceae bacterium]